MTRDLAILVGHEQPWLTTEQFLNRLDVELDERISWTFAAAVT